MIPLPQALSLKLSEDRTLATLSIAPGAQSTGRDIDAILAYLEQYRVRIDADARTAIEVLLGAFNADPDSPQRMIVACGVPARHGQDGRIDWAEGRDPADPRDVNGDPVTCAHVDEGDRIGALVPPSAGVDGHDVSGDPIPARDGVPFSFGHDDSVRVNGDGDLIATTPGAVFFEDGLLRVSTQLRFSSDITTTCEDVAFDGDVSVDGGVQDGRSVEASGSVLVRGLVGAARITGGIDTAFEGGVAGRRRALLSAGRDLRARYIDNANAVVGRHVFVDREIVDARLSAAGRLHCPDAALRGGHCLAGGVCAFAEIGSPSGLPTRLTLGELHDFDDLRPRLSAVVEAIGAAEADARHEYEALRTNAPTLTETQADQMTTLEFSLATLRRLRGRLDDADERISQVSARFTDIELSVERVIHRGVVVTIGGVAIEFGDPVRGPLRITLGADAEPLLTDLSTNETVSLREHPAIQSCRTPPKAA